VSQRRDRRRQASRRVLRWADRLFAHDHLEKLEWLAGLYGIRVHYSKVRGWYALRVGKKDLVYGMRTPDAVQVALLKLIHQRDVATHVRAFVKLDDGFARTADVLRDPALQKRLLPTERRYLRERGLLPPSRK
jgi:hypothetical protein